MTIAGKDAAEEDVDNDDTEEESDADADDAREDAEDAVVVDTRDKLDEKVDKIDSDSDVDDVPCPPKPLIMKPATFGSIVELDIVWSLETDNVVLLVAELDCA